MKKALSLALALTLTLCLAACGNDDSESKSGKSKKNDSSSQAVDMSRFEDMAGEYECVGVITNFNAMDAGVKSADADARFKGMSARLDGSTLEIDGRTFELEADKSENLYYTYIVTVKESGYDKKPHNSDRKFADEGFDGPVYFMFTKAGTDQGLGEVTSEDTIDLYWSPEGTTDWYFSLDLKRK